MSTTLLSRRGTRIVLPAEPPFTFGVRAIRTKWRWVRCICGAPTIEYTERLESYAGSGMAASVLVPCLHAPAQCVECGRMPVVPISEWITARSAA